MQEFWTIELAPAYGVSISKARYMTDEEKVGYSEWFQKYGLFSVGESTQLSNLRWGDMPQREQDGQFLGCDNQAWIISEEDKAAYLELEERRKSEKEEKHIKHLCDMYKRVIERGDRQPKLYTKEEAEREAYRYNQIYNEGGYGFVPHYVTIDEYNEAKAFLEAHS